MSAAVRGSSIPGQFYVSATGRCVHAWVSGRTVDSLCQAVLIVLGCPKHGNGQDKMTQGIARTRCTNILSLRLGRTSLTGFRRVQRPDFRSILD